MLGAQPPVLVFQQGVADCVETGGGVRYHYSALFGLRFAAIRLDVVQSVGWLVTAAGRLVTGVGRHRVTSTAPPTIHRPDSVAAAGLSW